MKRIISILIGMLLLSGAFVYAQDAAVRDVPDPQQKPMQITQEQREKIKTMRLELEKELKAIQTERKSAQEELQKLLKDENTSESILQTNMEKVSRYDIQMRLVRRRFQQRSKAILTPEQREMIAQNPRYRRLMLDRRVVGQRINRPFIRNTMREQRFNRMDLSRRMSRPDMRNRMLEGRVFRRSERGNLNYDMNRFPQRGVDRQILRNQSGQRFFNRRFDRRRWWRRENEENETPHNLYN